MTQAGRAALARRAASRGGTLVGFLFGIVVGLAVAVVVAAFVTRAPMPFVDKLARSGDTLPMQPPAPGAPMPDPNQGLQSGGDAMPGAPQVQPQQSTDPLRSLLSTLGQLGSGGSDRIDLEAPSGTGGGAGSAGARDGSGATQPRGGAAPIEARTLPPSAGERVAAADPQASYLLQAGAFRSRPDADSLRARLALMGFEARVLPSEVNGETLYRVRLGPYAGMNEMNRARTRLSDNGIEASVVRQR
ncbi:MAG: SPOR domain-containing protein [Burkholderiales bacterium]|nr:MAG: SPOR domain-containing protein [Burkholderiales bacterium]